jgi:predicted DCC family thiol-disulfide oxidoreductase YuxK
VGEHRSSVNGVVLYDGACGFCTDWLRHWTPILHRHRYGVDTLQAPWVAQRLGMNVDELLSDIRLIRPDGTLISGADVYLDVMRRVWWAYPLYAVCRLPGFNAVFRNAYRSFARNRYCISGQCSIDSSHRS